MGSRGPAMPSMPRRHGPLRRWLAGILLIAAGVGLVTMMGAPLVPGAHRGDATGSPVEDLFVFLFVWESSTHAWRVNLLEPLSEPLIQFEPSAPRLSVPAGKLPGPLGPLVLHLRSEGMGLPFRDRLLTPGDLPAQIPIDAPAVHQVQLVGNDEDTIINGIDNSRRLLAGTLQVTGVSPEGVIHLEYGGRQLRLAPGEGWGEARLEQDDGTVQVLPALDGDWEDDVAALLVDGGAATVLRLYNYGPWPAGAVEEVPAHQSG